MSCASNGRAFTGATLCHFTPGRSFRVNASRSGDHSQEVVRSGMTSLYSGGLSTPAFSLTRKSLVRLAGVLRGLSPWWMSKWAGSLGEYHFNVPPVFACLDVSTALVTRLLALEVLEVEL